MGKTVKMETKERNRMMPAITQEEWGRIQKEVNKHLHILLILKNSDKDKLAFNLSRNMPSEYFFLLIIELIKGLISNIKDKKDKKREIGYFLQAILEIKFKE